MLRNLNVVLFVLPLMCAVHTSKTETKGSGEKEKDKSSKKTEKREKTKELNETEKKDGAKKISLSGSPVDKSKGAIPKTKIPALNSKNMGKPRPSFNENLRKGKNILKVTVGRMDEGKDVIKTEPEFIVHNNIVNYEEAINERNAVQQDTTSIKEDTMIESKTEPEITINNAIVNSEEATNGGNAVQEETVSIKEETLTEDHSDLPEQHTYITDTDWIAGKEEWVNQEGKTETTISTGDEAEAESVVDERNAQEARAPWRQTKDEINDIEGMGHVQVASSDAVKMESPLRDQDPSSRDTHNPVCYGNEYPCYECNEVFASLFELLVHRETHSQRNLGITKDAPGSSSGELVNLNGNVISGNLDSPVSESTDDFSQYEKPFAGDNSFPVHKSMKRYNCEECDKSFSSSKAFTIHQRIHTGLNLHTCAECGKTFTTAPRLRRHHLTHTGEKPHTCIECGKSFTAAGSLAIHQRIHTGMNLHTCKECGKTTTSAKDLIVHRRIHTGVRPYTCLECGKSFTGAGNLKQHERIHSGVKPYTCGECGKSFRKADNLTVHQRIHTGVKPYVCEDCGKSFVTASYLTVHQRIHAGVKPYTCDDCGKSFASRSNLSVHQRIHTGNKPCVCTECGKSFMYANILAVHQRVHTGEKPYSCGECGKSFAQPGKLVRHKRVHAK